MEYTKTIEIGEQKDHLQNKTMWLGTKEVIDSLEWVFRAGKLTQEKVSFSPARLNCIMETIANCVDHFTDTKTMDINVKNISVNLVGSIWIIQNDGYGFNVVKSDKTEDKWSVEVALTHLMAGSNLHGDKSNCGTNGVGMKAIVANTSKFTIETYDLIRDILYSQTATNGVVDSPTLRALNKPLEVRKQLGGTKIQLTLMNDFGGCDMDIVEIVEAKLVQTKFYLDGTYGDKAPNIRFMGRPITFKLDMCDLMDMEHVKQKLIYFTTNGFKIALGLTSNNSTTALIVMNGIPVKKCSIVTCIKNQMRSVLKDELDKMCSKFNIKIDYKCLYNKLFIIIFGLVQDPQYVGQTKESITLSKDVVKNIAIPKQCIEDYWKGSKASIENNMLYKKQKRILSTRTEPDDKYIKPRRYGQHATLIISEGDSAQKYIENGIKSSSAIKFSDCGIFNIQGIPINVRKKIKKVLLKGKKQIIQTCQLLDNTKFQSLLTVLGFKMDESYLLNEDVKKLNFGRVIIAADRDHDGAQIAGLLLNMMHIFTPCLIYAGLVYILETPLIRVYTKGRTPTFVNFSSECEFENWKTDKDMTKYHVVYFKGLAGHNEEETDDSFSDLNGMLKQLTPQGMENFEIFYGNDVGNRKLILSSPLSIPIEYYKSRHASCGDFLKYEVGSFQRYVISRKTKSCYDGLVTSQRKVIYYMMMKRIHTPIKVSNLAASTIEPTNYHHGPKSLEDTIIRMGQKFVGSNVLPLLLPMGQFGSREFGRKSKYAGKSRYISAKLNTKLVDALIPKDDLILLPRVHEEGKIWEPLFFIPILPYAIMDSLSSPACGWSSNNWARDPYDVIRYVLSKIEDKPMPDSLSFFGRFYKTRDMSARVQDSKEVCIGKYTVNGNIIHITELPLGVWYHSYKKMLLKKTEVISVIDNSTKDKIDLKVKLVNIVEDMDSFLNITKIQNQLLNMLCLDMNQLNDKLDHSSYSIYTFKNYREIIDEWYKKREYFYKLRHERNLLKIQFDIIKLTNILKMVTDKFKLKHKKDIDVVFKDFCKIDHSILEDTNVKLAQYVEDMKCNKSYGDYKYLLNVTHSKRTEEGKLKIQSNIDELKMKYELQSTTGYKKIWIDEIMELQKVIDEGIKSNWTYGKSERFG